MMFSSRGSNATESKFRRSSCFTGVMRSQLAPSSVERYTPETAPTTKMFGLRGRLRDRAHVLVRQTDDVPGAAGIGAAVHAAAAGVQRSRCVA